MRFLVFFAAVVALAAAAGRDYTGYTYENFLTEFRTLRGQNAEPCPIRKRVFEDNLAAIRAHNAQERSWSMGVNEWADLSQEEFEAKFLTSRGKVAQMSKPLRVLRERTAPPRAPEDLSHIQPSADWSAAYTTVLSQGSCGSCWAHATVGALTGRAFAATGERVSLSRQQLTSCTPNERHCGGTGGCFGATFQLAAEYLLSAGFLTSEKEYPYISGTSQKTEECRFDPDSMAPALAIDGFHSIPANNKTELLTAIAKGGPVSISVAASRWHLYESGVFDGCTNAKSVDATVNHLVTAVGYDIQAGYLLLLNSWGPTWGEKGFMRLAMPEVEPSNVDPSPLDGSGCEDTSPPTIIVDGECGYLSDSAYPTKVTVF